MQAAITATLLNFVALKQVSAAGKLQALFSAGDARHNVTEYRIPLLLALPPQNSTLLAFAEARLPCVQSCGHSTFWGDSSTKHVAFRRSTDAGVSWTPVSFVHRSNGTNDNLNLGSVVYDHHTKSVLLHWAGCVHCSCTGTVPKPSPGKCVEPGLANVQQLRSTDEGASWSGPHDISTMLLDPATSPIFKLGEGSGVQLANGDLVVCGRVASVNQPACGSVGANCLGSACMLSTDGGLHWIRGGLVPATPQFPDNECEAAMLKNGSLLLNMRAGTARLLACSDDGGRSFVDVHPALSLSPVANCQGSMKATADGDGTLIFTAPTGSSKRRNLSIAASFDGGNSWAYERVVHAGPSAYSSLAPTTGGCSAVLFEGGSTVAATDSQQGISVIPSHYQHIYFTTVCLQQSRG